MAICITAFLPAARRARAASHLQQGRHFFLDIDDRLGLLKPLTQASIFMAELARAGDGRIGCHGLGAAAQRFERLERTGGTLAAPIGQRRGVEALTS
jgi:hypothetical protein